MHVNSLITHLQLKKMLVIYQSGHVVITFQLLETTPNFEYSHKVQVFQGKISAMLPVCIIKLEDLKVLRRSPDLFKNVKIGQGFTANI